MAVELGMLAGYNFGLEDARSRALDKARAKEGHLTGIPLAEVRRRLDAKFKREKPSVNSNSTSRRSNAAQP
jgi:hypothetical protein